MRPANEFIKEAMGTANSAEAVDLDCAMLQLHRDMTDQQKLDAISRFANELVSDVKTDFILLGLW